MNEFLYLLIDLNLFFFLIFKLTFLNSKFSSEVFQICEAP